MFKENDIKQITGRGATVKQIEAQVESFRKGFPWMKIVGPATPKRGIAVLSEDQVKAAAEYYDKASIAGKCKFVPASGAASRMFKDMFSGLSTLESGKDLAPDAPGSKFAARIREFAFYDPAVFGEPEDSAAYRKAALSKLLTPDGLDYGAKPKGVLKFHRYPAEVRTALAEHFVEAQQYMRNADGSCNLIVTISPEHRPLFEAAVAEIKDAYEARYGVKYNVKFTYQDKATDTVAVDPDNKPFRKEDGSLLFRPAGHGALIYNLNQVEEEVVSIKNIDNVSHEKLLGTTATWKKVLLGEALRLRDTIFAYLRRFDALTDLEGADAYNLCNEVEDFLDRKLCVQVPLSRSTAERAEMLRAKLDRPIRVCGMVRNEGEPGGGPFVIAGKDGQSGGPRLLPAQLQGREVQPAGARGPGSRLHQLQELSGP